MRQRQWRERKKERERERKRVSDRETERQRDREIAREEWSPVPDICVRDVEPLGWEGEGCRQRP